MLLTRIAWLAVFAALTAGGTMARAIAEDAASDGVDDDTFDDDGVDDDDESEDEDSGDDSAVAPDPGVAVVRDVAVRADGARKSRRGRRGRKPSGARSSQSVHFEVMNLGTTDEIDVGVTVRVGAADGPVVWSTLLDLEAGDSKGMRATLDASAAGQTLFAAVSLGDGTADADPANDSAVLGAPASSSDAAVGAALYAANGCVACHGDVGQGAGAPPIAGESARDVLGALREGEDGMPAYPNLTRADAAAIAAFLHDPASAGPAPAPAPAPAPSPAPAPAPTPGPPPAPAPAPTWTSTIQAIFSQKCAACHTGARAAAGVKLDTYANASANASRALSAVQAGRMPTSGPLPAADVQAIRSWVTAGTPR